MGTRLDLDGNGPHGVGPILQRAMTSKPKIRTLIEEAQTDPRFRALNDPGQVPADWGRVPFGDGDFSYSYMNIDYDNEVREVVFNPWLSQASIETRGWRGIEVGTSLVGGNDSEDRLMRISFGSRQGNTNANLNYTLMILDPEFRGGYFIVQQLEGSHAEQVHFIEW